MDNRLTKNTLFEILSGWNSFINKKVHLIACGGTALTLLNVKESTKDVDLLVPVEGEYEYLMRTLDTLGYKRKTMYGWIRDEGFIFDLYVGNKIFTTQLLESPLERNNNLVIKEFSNIYLAVLNYYDLIISKIFRSTSIDISDCMTLLKEKRSEIDFNILEERFYKTSQYDVSDENNKTKFIYFKELVKNRGLL